MVSAKSRENEKRVYSRTIQLGAQPDAIEASLKNGILTVTCLYNKKDREVVVSEITEG